MGSSDEGGDSVTTTAVIRILKTGLRLRVMFLFPKPYSILLGAYLFGV
jgi:hypothetical protein